MRERLEERAQQESSGAQRGRCWEYFGMKVRLHSGKLQHTFQPNPLYSSAFTQGRALCSLEDSAPISEDSDPRMPGASPAINHRRRATNTTLTQMFHFSPQRQCIFQGMNEHADYTALYQHISFREHFPLQKYISFLLPLHSILLQCTSPLLSISGLPKR